MTRRTDRLQTVGLYVGSVGVALALCAVLVSATGGSWPKVFSAMLDGAVRSPGAWGLTLTTAVPLLLVALGTIVATKTGLVNIGQEGQLMVGAAFFAYAAVRLPGPGPLVLVVCLVVAAIGGALWAAIAAVMKWWRGVPEVISTLLLVFLAFQFVAFGLTKTSIFLNREKVINKLNTGESIPKDTLLPNLNVFGNTVNSGVVIAVVVALIVGFVLSRTVWGFRLRMLGLNARTAQRAGVSAVAVGGAALATSGAFAGLAGGTMLVGGVSGGRLSAGFSGNFGWQGLLVALVARDRPMAAMPMAVVFAALRTGSGFLAATGVERRIADVVQAMLVLALLVPPAVLFIRDRRRAVRGASSTTGSAPVVAPLPSPTVRAEEVPA